MRYGRDPSLGEALAAALPPAAYFRFARAMLKLARALMRSGAIPIAGLRIAVGALDYLARAGHASWRARRALRHW